MKLAQIQFTPWDKVYNFSANDLNLSEGDKVVVRTDMGIEIGEVVGFVEGEANVEEEKKSVTNIAADNTETPGNPEETAEANESKEIKPVLRVATDRDMEKVPNLAEKKKALDYAKDLKDKQNLPMKFIDVHFAFDGSRITFAFIADGRVDFRELVKELTRHFGRTIRLQQIGIRDEARVTGDIGHCGQELCCRGHLNNLVSITSEMAELQQCSHRGSDRISGICGRLMCCLAYEQAGYEHLRGSMPPIGTKVNVDGKRGVIVGHHTLKQSVDVEFAGENGAVTVIEVDLNRDKKKNKKDK
ncbi:MAG: regulatory iron-sulfur-containing complex subunit RicT [Candidatus Falkowbacteria bacterium]